MRWRIAGKIFTTVMTVLFALIAVIYIFDTDPNELYHGLQAIAFAVLALMSATCFRYFED